MAAKRLHDGYEQDPDQPNDKRVRRLPSFSTVIREAVMVKQVQTLFVALEPLLRRVVQEELQAGLIRSPRYIERSSPETPTAEPPMWRLAFRHKPMLPIFTGSKIEDINGNPLEIILVDVNTGAPATMSQALRVEVVPILGDFPPEDRDHWAAEEFQQRGIVKERSGKRPLLTGDVSLTMRDGCVAVNELQFTDNSSWVRCRKFRIGVRVVPGSYDGPRIGEAMTEAFVVRDHRGELYRKHYPPVLGDDVWRLEKIGKEGAFHRKLTQHNVRNVQEFLRLLMVKPDDLRAIMGDGMTDRMWEVTTSHAKTCLPGDKVYMYGTQHGTVYVNSICQLVKIEIAGVEYQLHQLNKMQKMYVQQMLMEAYEHRNNLQEAEADSMTLNCNDVPLLQNAAQITIPAIAETPLWLQNSLNSQEIDFQIDEVPQASFALQWTSQMYNITG
uniref:Protein SAR DEFICIENT 1 n=1 Tax=Leersia perrieri TaxID=77586 RepID=A0A0D9UWG6_9ORYZ